MDKCPICNSALRVGKSFYSFKNDDTADAQTEAYTNLEMVCLNKSLHDGKDKVVPCPNYEKVIKTVTHKVN